jgi:hypothetical protein
MFNLDNTAVIEKDVRNFGKETTSSYFISKSYVKLGDEVQERLASCGVSPLSQLIYYCLSRHVLMNSSISHCTYTTILNKTNIGSKSTISKCLKELQDHGFISCLGQSYYRLLIGVYRGLKEKEITDISELKQTQQIYKTHKNDTNSFDFLSIFWINLISKNETVNELKKGSSTPSVPVFTSTLGVPKKTGSSTPAVPKKEEEGIYIYKQSNKQQQTDYQQKSNPVVVSLKTKKDLVFKEKSKFRYIAENQWNEWITSHGFEKCSHMIKTLEIQYPDEKITNPGGLMRNALQGGWVFESKKIRDHEKKEKYLEYQKKLQKQEDIRMKFEINQRKFEVDKDEEIYKKALENKSLVRTAEIMIQDDSPNLEANSEFFKIRVRHKLIEIYKRSLV